MLGLVLDKKDKADPDLNNTFKSKDWISEHRTLT